MGYLVGIITNGFSNFRVNQSEVFKYLSSTNRNASPINWNRIKITTVSFTSEYFTSGSTLEDQFVAPLWCFTENLRGPSLDPFLDNMTIESPKISQRTAPALAPKINPCISGPAVVRHRRQWENLFGRIGVGHAGLGLAKNSLHVGSECLNMGYIPPKR